ncbi:MAG: hypothetical protein ACFCVG_05950 [Kineosporiaceae bacterium]
MRSRSAAEVLESVVVGGLSVFLVGSLLVAVGRSGVPSLLAAAADRGHSAGWLGVAALCGVLSGWCAAVAFAGPRAVAPAALQWALGRREPTDLLRRELTATLVVGVLAGGVVAGMAALAVRALAGPWPLAAGAVWVLLIGAHLGLVDLQRRDAIRLARMGVSGLAVAACGITAWQAWGPTPALAVVAVAATRLLAGLRRKPLPPVTAPQLTPRWQLRRGAENRWLAGASIALMDGAPAAGARERAATRRRPPLPRPAYRLRWPAGLAVVVLLRSGRDTAGWALLLLVLGLAAAEVWGLEAAVVLVLTLELAVTLSLSRAYDAWMASPALPRFWGSGRGWVPVALAAPPVAACVGVVGVVAIALTPPMGQLLVMLALPVAVLLRRRSLRRGPDDGLLLATPAGAVPLAAANRVLAGPDVLLAAVLIVSVLP